MKSLVTLTICILPQQIPVRPFNIGEQYRYSLFIYLNHRSEVLSFSYSLDLTLITSVYYYSIVLVCQAPVTYQCSFE